MQSDVRWPNPRTIHTIVFDFDGVFTDNKVYVSHDGSESVRCDRADGLGIDLLRAAKARGTLTAEFFVLSKERNQVVEARAAKLRLTCYHGHDDKLAFLNRYFEKSRAGDNDPFRGLMYVGNDLNDMTVMLRAGFSVAPSDAHPRIRHISSAVLPQRGGEGFVRAIVERLLDIEHSTPEDIHELIRSR
jgi:3-deoxy-D-manno-octulosonate 8-phosphate phosphatase (KDO 8-P phosphatase)